MRRPDPTAPLTYEEVGATAGTLPPGYRHVRAARELGVGVDVFDEATRRLLTWEVHRRAGLTVRATAPQVQVGAVVVLGLGVGRLRVVAPCRVVRVVDEPRRRGFAYGTLPGHPERGEELFEVALQEDGRVRATITAFSRPATWWSRLGGPVGRRVQDLVTQRYLRALEPARP